MPVTIFLEAQTQCFYQRLADTVGLSLEQVLSDALFKLAGELSLEAIHTAGWGHDPTDPVGFT